MFLFDKVCFFTTYSKYKSGKRLWFIFSSYLGANPLDFNNRISSGTTTCAFLDNSRFRLLHIDRQAFVSWFLKRGIFLIVPWRQHKALFLFFVSYNHFLNSLNPLFIMILIIIQSHTDSWKSIWQICSESLIIFF